MPRSALRRLLALSALALALLAALPCAALAGGHACCAQVSCEDAQQAPCAQMGAAPCCAAPRAPANLGVTPALADAPMQLAVATAPFAGLAAALPTARTAPPALADHAAIRSVFLRL